MTQLDPVERDVWGRRVPRGKFQPISEEQERIDRLRRHRRRLKIVLLAVMVLWGILVAGIFGWELVK